MSIPSSESAKRRSKFMKSVFIMAIITFTFFSCGDDVPEEVGIGEYGETPAEYIAFLDDNDIDHYLDQFGNPYTQGELLVKFDEGFNQSKLDAVILELAELNNIPTDSIEVKQCACGTDDLVLLEFDEKLDAATLEPTTGSMGDQDGDDDGLSSGTSTGVSTSNNYYIVPLPRFLNGGEELPDLFGPPNLSIGLGYTDNGNDDKLRIAVLDSGLDFDHPDLANYENFSIWKGPQDGCYRLGYDFVNNSDIAIDQNGHGTQVTGVILDALEPYDVPVAIMPLKISNWNGSVALFDMFCAMSYAVSNGADIINISAGWYGAPNGIIQGLIEENEDVLFVCSAGNDGINTNEVQNNHWPSGFTFLPNVISVASMNEDNSGLADFSNFGTNTVVMAAPGESITTITPCDGQDCEFNTIVVSGTSFSAPYTAAIAAAHIQCSGESGQIRQALIGLGVNESTLSSIIKNSKYHDFDQITAFEDCER